MSWEGACTSANQRLLYSITGNSAISAENFGDSCCQLNPLEEAGPYSPSFLSAPCQNRHPIHPRPGFAAWGKSTHVFIASSPGQMLHRKPCKSFLLPLLFFPEVKWSGTMLKNRMSLFCHSDWKAKQCPADGTSTSLQSQELEPVSWQNAYRGITSRWSFQFKRL